jgi:diguanylate cyclase (GGDEF)-like protein
VEKPPIPLDEEERLNELQELRLLDTEAEERFDRFTRLARRIFDVPVALISLVDGDRQWFKSRQGLDVAETPRDVSFCGHAILGSGIFVVENAAEDARFRDNPLVTGEPRIQFYAGFPLTGPKGHTVGTLCLLDQKPRVLAEEDLEALRDIGAMVAGELASLQLASTDSLTGISNRRGFELLASQALAMCRRSGQAVSMVMIDMDGFKDINDTFGHEEGDRALIRFSTLLVETFRDSDVVARWGGDEFYALLTGADAQQAQIAVRRLGDALKRHNAEPGRRYELRFSAGVAEYVPDLHADIMDVMREADALMYERKRARSGDNAA